MTTFSISWGQLWSAILVSSVSSESTHSIYLKDRNIISRTTTSSASDRLSYRFCTSIKCKSFQMRSNSENRFLDISSIPSPSKESICIDSEVLPLEWRIVKSTSSPDKDEVASSLLCGPQDRANPSGWLCLALDGCALLSSRRAG